MLGLCYNYIGKARLRQVLITIVKHVYPFAVPIIPSPCFIAATMHVPVALSCSVVIVVTVPWVMIVGCGIVG